MEPSIGMRDRFGRAWYVVEQLEHVVAKALLGGYGRMVPFRGDLDGVEFRRAAELHCQAGCLQPVGRELFARDSSVRGRTVEPLRVMVFMRCRRCEECRRAMQSLWMARAADEFHRWPRTLMGTVTMSPVHHLELDTRARMRLWSQAVDFESLPEDEKFKERAHEFYLAVRLWMAKLRKGDGRHAHPRFRYLLVAERHDSEQTSPEMRQRPHFHLVLHECDVGRLVYGDPAAACEMEQRSGEWEHRFRKVRGVWRKFAFVSDDAFLRQKWTLGHTVFEWAETEQAAVYVCKYLTKAWDSRIKASKLYGNLGGADQGNEVTRETSTPPTSLGALELRSRTKIMYDERQLRLMDAADKLPGRGG